MAEDVAARAANRRVTLVKSVLLDQFAERTICLEEIVVFGGTKCLVLQSHDVLCVRICIQRFAHGGEAMPRRHCV